MLTHIPGWIQASVAAVLLIAVVVAFSVHAQDDIERNHESIQRLHLEIQDVDDIVRDNQQRLAHIEAILEGRPSARTVGAVDAAQR